MEKEELDFEMKRYWRTLSFSLLIGLLAGCVVAAYRLMISYAVVRMDILYSKVAQSIWWIVPVVIIFLLMALIVGYLLKKQPFISGSGIPQVQYVVERKLELTDWGQLLLAKFVGGCLCLAAGLSLGREGPCVQMGGWLGYGVNDLLRRWQVSQKVVMCCGAGAGLAAAFNAPLAGTVFVLEELRKKISPIILLSTLLAALTADAVVQKVFGMSPVLAFAEFSPPVFENYWGFIIVGVMTGVTGVVFNRSLIVALDLFGKIPLYRRIFGIFLCAGIVALLCPQVLGGRDALIKDLTINLPVIKIILALLIMKFLFTIVSYGAGVPGGIFLPLLMIGALVGAACASFLTCVGFSVVPELLIVLAMAGCFSAIVKAPVTGMILIAEMTGSFTCFMPVAVVCTVAMLVSDALGGKPIYEVLLERLEK